jgi:hypothetical protein
MAGILFITMNKITHQVCVGYIRNRSLDSVFKNTYEDGTVKYSIVCGKGTIEYIDVCPALDICIKDGEINLWQEGIKHNA